MSFILSVNYFIWLLISILFFALGEFLSKEFALNTSKLIYILYIFIAYSFGILTWLAAIVQKNQLSIIGAMWSVLSLVATVLIGVLIFSEKLNILSITGIILGIISVALLSIA